MCCSRLPSVPGTRVLLGDNSDGASAFVELGSELGEPDKSLRVGINFSLCSAMEADNTKEGNLGRFTEEVTSELGPQVSVSSGFREEKADNFGERYGRGERRSEK